MYKLRVVTFFEMLHAYWRILIVAKYNFSAYCSMLLVMGRGHEHFHNGQSPGMAANFHNAHKSWIGHKSFSTCPKSWLKAFMVQIHGNLWMPGTFFIRIKENVQRIYQTASNTVIDGECNCSSMPDLFWILCCCYCFFLNCYLNFY